MPIDTLVLDFDGTCTDIPARAEAYLGEVRKQLKALVPSLEDGRWQDALDEVRAASPDAGWMLGGAPSAPAAADPFILAGEAIALINRQDGRTLAMPDLHTPAYTKFQSPFRPELAEVLRAVDQLGIRVHFVTNSDTSKIANRLDDLLRGEPGLRAKICVEGNAAKFRVQEPRWDAPQANAALLARFRALPAEGARPRGADGAPQLSRPIYLRRGSYLDALAVVWSKGGSPETTLVCGDVWELDLAMPAALGCKVHLIERAEPYPTCAYELAACAHAGATHGDDLKGLLAQLGGARA